VSIVSDTTDRIVTNVSVGSSPLGIAFNPTKGETFVAKGLRLGSEASPPGSSPDPQWGRSACGPRRPMVIPPEPEGIVAPWIRRENRRSSWSAGEMRRDPEGS